MVIGKKIDKHKRWDLENDLIEETNVYKYLEVYFSRSLKVTYHIETFIMSRKNPARPPKIGKNMIFLPKIVIFHTKYQKKISRLVPLGAIILSAPPNLKSWIRPCYLTRILDEHVNFKRITFGDSL